MIKMKRCALITGASGGIGGASALRLARDGFNIAACYHSDRESALRLQKELETTGAEFKIYQTDVSDFDSVKKVFEDAADFFGGVSVLANCAGISSRKLFTDTTPEDFDRITDVNFRGVYNCCLCAVPFMVSQKSGKIINVASMWGVRGASCEALYSATKAAVIGLTQALARELAPSNVQANCVAPGAVDTKMNDDLSEEEKRSFAEKIPMGRFASPEEIAGVVSFLASADSDYKIGRAHV